MIPLLKSRFSFGSTILEEDYKVPFDFLDNDSIIVKRITKKDDIFRAQTFQSLDRSLNNAFDDKRFSITTTETDFNDILPIWRAVNPIYERVSSREITATLREKNLEREI